MTLGWCSSRRYLTSRTADMSRPSLNWPTLIFLMAILRPVASSRPEEGERVDGCSRAREKQVKQTAIDDCIRSLSHFLVLHPFSSREYWDMALQRWWGHTHHLFCRSALALSTASISVNRRETSGEITRGADKRRIGTSGVILTQLQHSSNLYKNRSSCLLMAPWRRTKLYCKDDTLYSSPTRSATHGTVPHVLHGLRYSVCPVKSSRKMPLPLQLMW